MQQVHHVRTLLHAPTSVVSTPESATDRTAVGRVEGKANDRPNDREARRTDTVGHISPDTGSSATAIT